MKPDSKKSKRENIIVTKKVIAVLLVITICLSLIGTWVFINALETQVKYKMAAQRANPTGEGNVFLTITPPPKAVTGNVILNINNPENA